MLAGFLIDCLIGDPAFIPHPVVLIGKTISRLEKIYRKAFPDTPIGKRLAGRAMNLTVLLLTGAVSSAIVFISKAIDTRLCFVLCTIMSWQILAAKCLSDEAKKVLYCLKNEGLAAARKQVGMLVGRDTENLTEEQVVKAAVETVAENTSDGVIAPMFWMLIGGPIGGFVYKAVNTMDSMLGYLEMPYRNIGMVSAKMDDVMNFVPSRLSALIMLAAGQMLKMDVQNGWKIFRRDRFHHASPNSAQTESVCAGLLGLRLAGDAWYHGVLHKKQHIGDALREIEYEDIPKACRLLYVTAALSLLLFSGAKLLLLVVI